MMPPVSFEQIDMGAANECLRSWAHKMGPLERPYESIAYALMDEGRPVAVTIHSTLVREHVGGGASYLDRRNCIELSRLCAVRSGLCRVALRLWREFVFPKLGYQCAMSYQDADLHNGNTYRFDGWRRIAYSRAGGIDRRSGRKGRNKWVWLWTSPDFDYTPSGADRLLHEQQSTGASHESRTRLRDARHCQYSNDRLQLSLDADFARRLAPIRRPARAKHPGRGSSLGRWAETSLSPASKHSPGAHHPSCAGPSSLTRAAFRCASAFDSSSRRGFL